jgi:hypothetical protein
VQLLCILQQQRVCLLLLLLLRAACISAKPKLPTPAILDCAPCIALSNILSMLHSSNNRHLWWHLLLLQFSLLLLLLLQQALHCDLILLLLLYICSCFRSCSISLSDVYGRYGQSQHPPSCLLLLLHAIRSPGPSHRAWYCCWRLPLLHEERVHRLARPCHRCRRLLLPLCRQLLLLLLLLQRLLLLPLLLLLLLEDFLGLALRLAEENIWHLAAPISSSSTRSTDCCCINCTTTSTTATTSRRRCCCSARLPICADSFNLLRDHNITISIFWGCSSSSSRSSSTCIGPPYWLLLLCAPAPARLHLLLLLLVVVVVPVRVTQVDDCPG